MKSSERGWVRGAVVIGIAGTMMAVALFSPALAVRLATTSYVKQKVNQAVNQSLSRFLQQPIAYLRSDPITVAAGAATSTSLACPPGGVAIGGGAAGGSVLEDWDLESSYPSNGATTAAGTTGWTSIMENATVGSLSYRAYVVCGGATSTVTNFTAGSTPVRTWDGATFAPESIRVKTSTVPRT